MQRLNTGNTTAAETRLTGWSGVRHALMNRVDGLFQYWALAPTVILLLVMTVYPLWLLVQMSVSEVEFRRGVFTFDFNPERNFRLLLNDWIIKDVILNTLLFAVVVVTAQMIIGFFVAYLASRVGTARRFIRTILVLPILVPPIAIGSMWRLMYNYEFGPINQVLLALGLPEQSWLGTPGWAMFAVMLVDVWHWFPFVFLIALAGLESLNSEVIEAAMVDGAKAWQMLHKIIVPLIWPTLSVALILRLIGAFKVFDEIFLLTSGGPGTSTVVLSWYIYKVMFKDFRLGYGALLALLSIVLIGTFVLVSQRLQPQNKTGSE